MDTKVCDISGCGTFLVSGSGARRFLQTMFSGNIDACSGLMESAQGLVLNSEGEVVDAALVVLTGADEYMMLTSEQNADEVLEWLSAHVELEDDAGRIFSDVALVDARGLTAVLSMYGTGCDGVFEGLMAACEGRIAVMGIDQTHQQPYGFMPAPAHILVAPINAAASIGDYLLEEPGVEVVDIECYHEDLQAAGAYEPNLYGAAYVKPSDANLERLLRPQGGFVGSLALGA